MMKSDEGDKSGLKMVNPGSAAVDIGSTKHVAAVNPDSDDTPVCAFGTFTQDLHELAEWFQSCGVTSVAMESTCVYWIPAFEILEQHGIEVILVSARYAMLAKSTYSPFRSRWNSMTSTSRRCWNVTASYWPPSRT
jgi:transposase|nr:transposase [Georhizobium profundi]